MKNISNIFFNIVLVSFLFITTVIIYTENVKSFDEEIIRSIESQLDKRLDVKSKIDSIDILWSGIKPKILIKNLNLTNDRNQIILNAPTSELEIDIANSLKIGKISINEFTINDTSINLEHDSSNVSFNNLNLFKKSNDSSTSEIPLIIFNNSKLKLTNIKTNSTEEFKIDNFIASYRNNLINFNARFMHSSSTEPITIILKGVDDKKNGMKSKIFLSANSIKLPYNILPESIRQLDSNRMSVRLWISMLETKIKKVTGNISSDSLNLKLNRDVLKIKNVNSDLLYVNNDTSDTLSLMRMNYDIQDNKITDNMIVISKDKNDNLKLFIKKSEKSLLKLVTKNTFLNNTKLFDKILNNDIYDLQVHLTENNSIDYFSLSLQGLDLDYQNKYFATDINADIYGTLRAGRINIKNSNIKANNINIEKISGIISYSTKGKSMYFSSSNFKNKQGHKIILTGNKVAAYPSLKIKLSTTLNKILESLDSIQLDNIESNAKVESNIYFYDGTFFTNNKIKNFYFNKLDATYLTSKELEIFSTSKIISSKRFNMILNNQNQDSKINTNISSNSYQYTVTSIGNIEADTLQNIFEISSKIFNGKAKVKSIFSYNYETQNISLYSSSDLVGVSLDLVEPWSKEKNKKADFVLNYQHFPKKSYPLKINLNKNEFEFKFTERNGYINIKSPAARGIIKYPYNVSEKSIFSGSFEYIDTTSFSSDKFTEYFPAINVKSKHVKTADTVFDNVHLIMTPNDEYIEITKLDFKNLNLEMSSTGRWYLKNSEKVEITANIKSEDFGRALKGIGYPNTIRGGKMSASINSKWNGSLEEFSFASSSGKIQLNIKDGQINELDKGTQAIGQVLGLLSIASIPKRLSLDFSDFFSKGLSFDNLESEIVLNSGIADINRMNIIGSFGEMRLSGESNLVKRTHNQTLIFIPDLSSTSLVTGAVIGGPIGAAASIFYDKLLKEFGVDTNKLAGIEYSIKGSWDDPKIKVTQSFKPIIN